MASSDVKTVTDPVVSAEVAGLNYVSDRDPGIARIEIVKGKTSQAFRKTINPQILPMNKIVTMNSIT